MRAGERVCVEFYKSFVRDGKKEIVALANFSKKERKGKNKVELGKFRI